MENMLRGWQQRNFEDINNKLGIISMQDLGGMWCKYKMNNYVTFVYYFYYQDTLVGQIYFLFDFLDACIAVT